MSAVVSPRLMTTDELLAMPDDGKERWLIRGELWEKDMTKRNRFHARLTIRIGYLLESWCEKQPDPRGEVVGGEAGFILHHNPDSTVGIDVAYVSAATKSRQTDQTTLYDGPPVLAVEILSPSNTHEEVTVKVREYLNRGVKLVWVVDPDFRTVSCHRPGIPAQALDFSGVVSADPDLPGFSCPVADFFR